MFTVEHVRCFAERIQTVVNRRGLKQCFSELEIENVVENNSPTITFTFTYRDANNRAQKSSFWINGSVDITDHREVLHFATTLLMNIYEEHILLTDGRH